MSAKLTDLVSVGFLVFNDVAFLRRALDSLLAQTHANLEVLICDDFSTDGSAETCQKYAQADSRIRYFRHESNIGISKNMEFALASASGSYFFWAADDDTWDPRFVERLLGAIKADPTSIVAFCPYQLVDENDRPFLGSEVRARDYADPDPTRRIAKLARLWDDGFGYGLFRRGEILDVRFPIWWWVNRSTQLNNIYPTLCFYLARGNFCFVDGPPLWFNRIKSKPNHHAAFDGKAVQKTLAALLRHVDCHVKCVESVYLGSGSRALTLRSYPPLLRRLVVQLQAQLRGAASKASASISKQTFRSK